MFVQQMSWFGVGETRLFVLYFLKCFFRRLTFGARTIETIERLKLLNVPVMLEVELVEMHQRQLVGLVLGQGQAEQKWMIEFVR